MVPSSRDASVKKYTGISNRTENIDTQILWTKNRYIDIVMEICLQNILKIKIKAFFWGGSRCQPFNFMYNIIDLFGNLLLTVSQVPPPLKKK